MTPHRSVFEHPHARQESIALFQEMFGISEREGALLTISVLTALVLDQQRGCPCIHIREDTYYVGEQPLMPYLRQLRGLRESYTEWVKSEPYTAYGQVQEHLRQLLNPSRVAQRPEA